MHGGGGSWHMRMLGDGELLVGNSDVIYSRQRLLSTVGSAHVRANLGEDPSTSLALVSISCSTVTTTSLITA